MESNVKNLIKKQSELACFNRPPLMVSTISLLVSKFLMTFESGNEVNLLLLPIFRYNGESVSAYCHK